MFWKYPHLKRTQNIQREKSQMYSNTFSEKPSPIPDSLHIGLIGLQ